MQDEARMRAVCERIREYHCQRAKPFDYPPAPEEQVRTTELALGFPLPAMLRMLYREVANGGNILDPDPSPYAVIHPDSVSPFVGVLGGAPYTKAPWAWDVPLTIGDLVSRSGWRLHPCISEALQSRPGSFVICLCGDKPEGFVTIQESAGMTLELDGWTGHIYAAGYWGELIDGHGREMELNCFWYVAPSLEELLEHMLDGTVSELYTHEGELTPAMLEAASCSDSPQSIWRGLVRIDLADPAGWLFEDVSGDAAHSNLPDQRA